MPNPGDAYDRTVPGRSFAFDYIASRHPSESVAFEPACRWAGGGGQQQVHPRVDEGCVGCGGCP